MENLTRIKEIREKRKLSQSRIAEVLEIPQQQYSRYENEKNEIPVRYVIKLCKFYKVSADWMLGLDQNEITEESKNENTR